LHYEDFKDEDVRNLSTIKKWRPTFRGGKISVLGYHNRPCSTKRHLRGGEERHVGKKEELEEGAALVPSSPSSRETFVASDGPPLHKKGPTHPQKHISHPSYKC
jgi:hypothetical protein